MSSLLNSNFNSKSKGKWASICRKEIIEAFSFFIHLFWVDVTREKEKWSQLNPAVPIMVATPAEVHIRWLVAARQSSLFNVASCFFEWSCLLYLQGYIKRISVPLLFPQNFLLLLFAWVKPLMEGGFKGEGWHYGVVQWFSKWYVGTLRGTLRGSGPSINNKNNKYNNNIIINNHNDRMYDYFSHGFETLSVIKHLKTNFFIKWGSVVFLRSLRILDVNSHWFSKLWQFFFFFIKYMHDYLWHFHHDPGHTPWAIFLPYISWRGANWSAGDPGDFGSHSYFKKILEKDQPNQRSHHNHQTCSTK